MKALIVYESMFGNTRQCAEAIASGFAGSGCSASVVRVDEVTADDMLDLDVLVVGGPTHARGLSRPSTRQGAESQANDPARHLTLEAGATNAGLREWLAQPGALTVNAAAFDTRARLPRAVSGAASKKIGRGLRRRGCHLVTRPMSFFVTKQSTLIPGEDGRATQWGAQLAELCGQRVSV